MTQWLTKLSLFLFLSLFQVANLACSISNNEEGVKLVRMAATQIDSLCPQVKGLNLFFPPSVQFKPLAAVLYVVINRNPPIIQYNAPNLQNSIYSI